MFELQRWTNKDIESRFTLREFETKIGQDVMQTATKKYKIIGVEESIGPRANAGNSGAENAFEAFCQKFLNMQSTNDLRFDAVTILGKVVLFENEKNSNLKEQVESLDKYLLLLLQSEIKDGEIPIIIGGGHNNALPLVRFNEARFQKPLQVINFDAHADYRPLEGRHSGNPFSYAFSEQKMKYYSVIGLHKRYNSQKILDGLKQNGHFHRFFEDYLDEKHSFSEDLSRLYDLALKRELPLGIELDLDTISMMPSSAMSPSAFSMTQARKYVRKLAAVPRVCYVHIPEGAPKNAQEEVVVGKALAYLVSDFIEIHSNLR